MESLFAFLRDFWEHLRPWITVPPWERGVRVRLGKHVKLLRPGVHLVIPFVDVVDTVAVMLQIVNLPNQSLRTLDDKTVAVSAAAAYRVSDAVKLYTEVHNYDESLVNLTMGLIADYVANHSWADCALDAIQRHVSTAVRREAKRWGIDIDHVYITDLCQHRALRLLTETTYKKVGGE
mgnify:FL=1